LKGDEMMKAVVFNGSPRMEKRLHFKTVISAPERNSKCGM
jgi:hypothetical protein